MIDKESFERILDRERKARKEAERIMEEKSLELLKVNESLLTLNANLEKNISERTQEIKKNADQLHILFNENPFPVMVYDKVALKILDVNKTAIVKYGYTKNEFLQKTIYDLHPTGEVEKLEKYCSKKSEKKSGSSSWKHLSAKRKQFDVRITA
ncbi:MAG: PAS domain-containing protein, partial [Flavobacteriaceae bacterium]|nr:PAS domain-containing protein [Flavobacteriaceae bacterium]